MDSAPGPDGSWAWIDVTRASKTRQPARPVVGFFALLMLAAGAPVDETGDKVSKELESLWMVVGIEADGGA